MFMDAATAVQVAGAIPVAVSNITPTGAATAIGIWTMIGTAVVAFIKYFPVFQLHILEARAKLRGEKRDDLKDCNARVDTLEGRVSNLETRLTGALVAYRIVEQKLESLTPNCLDVQQARAVLRVCFDMSEMPKDLEELLQMGRT